MPFNTQDIVGEGGDVDRRDPGHPATGKGLSSEQQKGLDMVKHIMLSLDEEDGLDEIYSFTLVLVIITDVFSVYSCFLCESCFFSDSFCRNALEQLHMFKRIEKRPMAWPCQLTIGSSLSIRIVGYKAVS